MSERKSIVTGIQNLGSEIHEEHEEAIIKVMSLYSGIADRFEKDSKYGKEFVENNQTLIGQLVQAAILEINNNKTGCILS